MKETLHIELMLGMIILLATMTFIITAGTYTIIKEQQNDYEVDQRVLKELIFADEPSISLDYIKEQQQKGALK